MEDWAEIRRLHRAEGMPIKEIARVLGISRNTVRAALRSDAPPKYRAQAGGVDRGRGRAADPGVAAGVSDDAGDGDRRADRLDALDHGAQGPGGGAAAGRICRRTRRARTSYEPGEIAQCDLWFPPIDVPVGFGQARGRTQLPVLTMVSGYSRWLSGAADPVPRRRRTCSPAGGSCIERLGAVPRVLVWDGEGAIGRWRAGQVEADRASARRSAARSAAKVDRAASRATRRPRASSSGRTAIWRRSFLPGRSSPVPADFNAQLQQWLAPGEHRGRAGRWAARPTDRIAADRAAMLALPPVAPATGWRTSVRLPRDHYVRLDSNDYSVHPAVIGRRIEVDRRPGPGPGVLRRQGRRRPRTGLGLAPDHHRPRARRRREAAAPRARRGAAPGARAEVEQTAAWPTTTQRSVSTAGWRDGHPHDHEAGQPVTSAAELAFLTRALKAPTLREAVDRLAERARAESWTHEEFLVACLQREVSARESPTAAKAASAPPGSRPASRSRSSTSTTPAPSNAT